jgi:transposase
MRRVAQKYFEEGKSAREVGRILKLAPSTAVKWRRRFLEEGSIKTRKIGGTRQKKIRGDHEIWLRERVSKGPFTLRGLAKELAERGLKVDQATVLKFLRAEGLSYKKTADRNRARPARRRPQTPSLDQARPTT